MKRPNQLLTSLDTRMNFIRPHYRYLNIVHWLGELNWNPLAVFIERKIRFLVPDGGYVDSPVPGQSFERCIDLEPCESSTWSLSDFFLCVEKYFPFSGTFMEHFFGYSATGFFFFWVEKGKFLEQKIHRSPLLLTTCSNQNMGICRNEWTALPPRTTILALLF